MKLLKKHVPLALTMLFGSSLVMAEDGSDYALSAAPSAQQQAHISSEGGHLRPDMSASAKEADDQ